MGGGRSILGFVAALAASAVLAMAPTAASGGATASGPLPRCQTAGLVIWAYPDEGGGVAGGFYDRISFANFSGHSCALRGSPGVTPVDIHGHRIGSTVPSSVVGAHTVRIPPGGTATALMKVVDTGVFAPSECRPVLAAGLRVQPPGQLGSKLAPFPVQVCSRIGHSNLEVHPVQLG